MATKIQLVHFKPMITLSFYNEYQKKILNEYKYDNVIIPITGFYETSANSTFLRFEDFSFCWDKNPQNTGKLYMIDGLLAHYSTPDAFDKAPNLDLVVKTAKEKKSHFILFTYGDLKTFVFKSRFILLYKDTEYKIKKINLGINDENIKKDIDEYITSHSTIVNEKSWYYKDNSQYILINDISTEVKTIPIIIKNALYDASLSNLNPNTIILSKSNSTFLSLTIDSIKPSTNSQPTSKDKMEITQVDLKRMFNPETIASNAVDLNINLMKWRMSPFLDIDIIKKSKYLLIGAGTLGCHVSRCLLGWGAKYITFIDNGKVSYSNPVRQSLYTFKDSQNTDNNYKSLLAAEKLKEIFPLVESKGFNIQIPLPGRTLIDDIAKENYIKNLNILEEQIKENDIIFLLTDSRESRWYPTVIAKANNKRVITAAIGFDSFLVMRHGTKENGLGCYFCTDIVTPTDTSGNRTLDQQCTISRPGVSMICSGMAIELAMSIMNDTLNQLGKAESAPHQIRGSLLNYSTQCLINQMNKNCVACSDGVVDQYVNKREEFIINVMNDPYYIEKISGVDKLINDIKLDEIDLNDKDDF